jgi:hypothetical protein
MNGGTKIKDLHIQYCYEIADFNVKGNIVEVGLSSSERKKCLELRDRKLQKGLVKLHQRALHICNVRVNE